MYFKEEEEAWNFSKSQGLGGSSKNMKDRYMKKYVRNKDSPYMGRETKNSELVPLFMG